MTDYKSKLLNLLADVEVLIRKGKWKLALESLAKLREEIEKV